MSEAITTKRESFSTFLVIACVALSALVVALAWQNRKLKSELSAAHAEALGHTMPADALKEGDRVEPLDLVAAGAGTPHRVEFDGTGGKTLLFVFSSTCPACQQTFPAWNELVAGLPPDVRVVGIQSDLAGAAPVSAARFPIYGFNGTRPKTMEKIPFVPCTAVLAPDGSVAMVTFGVPTDEQREQVKAALGA